MPGHLSDCCFLPCLSKLLDEGKDSLALLFSLALDSGIFIEFALLVDRVPRQLLQREVFRAVRIVRGGIADSPARTTP